MIEASVSATREVTFDPVTLEILWARLINVVDEMAAVLLRTAFSTILGAASDLGCEIMDEDGAAMAHATRSAPLFNVMVPRLTQELIRRFGRDAFRPGDVFVTNDPWIVSGHLPDIGVVTPFFKNGRLVGFAGTITHAVDVGGVLSGIARDIFEEGIFIPPTRLYDRGERNEQLVDILANNVRAPREVLGDLMAEVEANNIGIRRSLALLDEYGLPDFRTLSRAIQERSELVMRQAILAIPDGDYPARWTFDELDGPMTIELVVRVRGSDLHLDYTWVPPEHPRGGINCTFQYATGHSLYPLNCLLAPQIPNNEGMFKPIRISAPPGTILNCGRRASVYHRTYTGWQLGPVITLALAEALPEAAAAPSGLLSAFVPYVVDEDGPHLEFTFEAGGMGAGARTDGIHACQHPTSAADVPIELFESRMPLLYRRKELRTDSGGPGRQRGGCGVVSEVGPLPDQSLRPYLTTLMHRRNHPALGLLGGMPGLATELVVDGEQIPGDRAVARGIDITMARPDQSAAIHVAGGGGFGPAAQRDPVAVWWDVRNGIVSAEAAERLYGVVIEPESGLLDSAGTARRRQVLSEGGH
ncbi:MAG: hydantoinase B/oxoprolinase family protein [Chloroflexi bacterium]|nr:hydantoinase B/oxoprolinase family protein [Chloroflexota bacterium]